MKSLFIYLRFFSTRFVQILLNYYLQLSRTDTYSQKLQLMAPSLVIFRNIFFFLKSSNRTVKQFNLSSMLTSFLHMHIFSKKIKFFSQLNLSLFCIKTHV